jgi:hypothetical protein
MGKPEGKRPLRIPKRRWEDNIKMGLSEIGLGSVTSGGHTSPFPSLPGGFQ